jgi:hypothetical protein
VDYHQGLISADISAERPHLQFIKFPGIETNADFMEGRGLPETLRTAAFNEGFGSSMLMMVGSEADGAPPVLLQ